MTVSWAAVWRKRRGGFVAEDDGAEFLEFLPLVAPVVEDEVDDLVKEGGFEVAEVATGLDGVAGAAEEAVDDGEAEVGVEVEEADALEGFGLEKGEVAGIGEVLDKFLVAEGLEFGHAEAELDAEVDREVGGEGADEVLVTESDAAELAGGEEGGLAEVEGLDVLGAIAGGLSLGTEDGGGGLRLVDRGGEAFDLALGEDFRAVGERVEEGGHGGRSYWMANSVK
ncbi:MAG: hypothetical protein M5U12_15325 [Verrucomicrobia bacterium]|nr:hypothetical protein [Verrucomicrobiota bacterium]